MTGMGRAFSSGYDIGGERPDPVWPYGIPEGHSAAEMLDHWRERSRSETARLMQIWELSKPVIAAVQRLVHGRRVLVRPGVPHDLCLLKRRSLRSPRCA